MRYYRCRRWLSLAYAPLNWVHAIVSLNNDRPCWTLVLRGREVRKWGFHTECGWQHWKPYCAKLDGGLPICEDTPEVQT